MNPTPQAPAGTGPVTIGAVLAGRYRVTARIGAGGMATIYRARDESLDRDVAVKVLHAHLAHDESLQARFRAEARAAAGLLHPNIVNVFDQGVADLPYIVMEYVDGPSLREVLLQRGRLTPGEVLAIAEPVCQALARAHAAGVVHRDVKPENVLIAADGTVKVADFGIARAIADTSHTATGTLVGSVHYLAPELMEGAPATSRSDQYAVGVVLFELLTGRKPLPAETPMAVAMRHAREPIPPARQFVSDVPPAVDGAISRATQRNPEKRFSDLGALISALRAAIPGGPTPVVLDGAADGTMVIPVAAEDTVTVPRGRARPRPQRREGGGTRRWLLWAPVVLLLLAAAGFSAWNWVLAPVTQAPQLVSLSEVEAHEVARDAGLGIIVADRRHDLSAPAGTVLSQDPAAQQPLRRGDAVRVVLSDGPAPVAVPDVTNMTVKKATQRLARDPLHLEVATEEVFSDDVPAGRVVAHEPPADATAPQGSVVTLRVSKGVEQVEVPKVVGLPRREAAAALRDAKLQVDVQRGYSDEHPEPGTVAAQSVAVGTSVDKGTTVTITVSRGAATVELPDLVGDPIGDAAAAVRSLGLVANVIEQERPLIGRARYGSFGRVEAQDPRAGARVERGATVDLFTFSQAAEQEDDG